MAILLRSIRRGLAASPGGTGLRSFLIGKCIVLLAGIFSILRGLCRGGRETSFSCRLFCAMIVSTC